MEKPGYQTTEFWLTLVSQIIPLLVLTGALDSAAADYVKDTASEIVKHAFALLALIVPVATYVYGRAKIKAAALEKK